jgi:hypothetical protein
MLRAASAQNARKTTPTGPAPAILKKCFRNAAQFTEQQKVPALRVLK